MWLALAASLAAAAPLDDAYLAELTARARALGLAQRPEWQKLLHYVPNIGAPGVHGLVDSPGFFNAPQGKTDPQAELEATLASFYVEMEETPQRQSPQCAFPARYAWLDGELGFDPQRLPRLACKRYREWRAALNAKGLTLVFASAYLNNPASMYGHTLLRVDARDQDERTRLLAYTISFAADTDETNGLVFAVKGLLGGYAGTYSMLPYYLKVREYSDLENRDLWEYELALTEAEVDRVLAHAWELLPAYWAYYFFDENCSYHLLRLIQVARPELDLAAPFRWWALPTDTVRAVTAEPGLTARAVYRPASATLIAQRLEAMSGEERRLTKELSLRSTGANDPRLAALPAARQAAILEASHDYVEYRRATGKPDVADPRALARELLLARSRVEAPSQAPAVAAPARPDEGHASSRTSFGLGTQAGRDFGELRVRPTYHDTLDPVEGYVPGAQTEFVHFTFRHDRSGGTQLESLVPIELLSLSPRDEFFRSWSWKASAGWRRSLIRDGTRPLQVAADLGAGAAWGSGSRMAYAMLEGALRVHSRLDDGHALGAGASAGLLFDAGPRLRLHAYARGLKYFFGENDTPGAVGLESRFTLGRDLALRFDLARQREAGRSFDYGTLSLMVYH
ncbi:MAG: Lnb N-terminal periplasmic domain-containing protein [Betaproteobacteria bacterium]